MSKKYSKIWEKIKQDVKRLNKYIGNSDYVVICNNEILNCPWVIEEEYHMISFKAEEDDDVSLVVCGDGWIDMNLSYEEQFENIFKGIKIFKDVVEFKSVRNVPKNSYEEISGDY